ncbi:restriction endonuclease subunit S [Acinetobacter sp. NEB 394]|uniref:restriction endonuclease subunit S n=1 Tax=Acinetobacter sp. NEB 394 TaxID=2743575 RepID=UPI0015967A20|nr:restriction endonuclease subunit S [Acinetobacter sp. NEB 394]QKY92166.1 restriction endonuclease subunit S [Acinetobacter sp. NEB 394]
MFPKLRFKEFDGDWLKLKYKDVLTIKYGKDHKSLNDGDIPVYGTGGLMRHVNKYLYDGESILIGRKGTIDKPKYINEKFWTVDTLFYTEIEESIVPLFLYQHALEVNWLGLNEATGVPSLNTTSIYNIDISIPSKEEQTKIASFLSNVDEKISQLTQKLELLSQYKQGMMQKLFSQQIRFRADDGSEFGEWEEKELKDIAEINPKSKKLPESFIYIDLESVEKGQLLLQKNIELQDAPSRAQRLLAKGDVLFQMVRPYQQNNYYFNLSGEYVASTGYAQIRTKLDSKFIYYALHEKTFLDEVMNRCTGTSYPAINSSDLSSIEILIPCLEEQTKIANFLSSIGQKIEVVAQQIEQAKQWKKGLLQQMFI